MVKNFTWRIYLKISSTLTEGLFKIDLTKKIYMQTEDYEG